MVQLMVQTAVVLFKYFAPIVNYEALKFCDFYIPNMACREGYVSYHPRKTNTILERNCHFPRILEILICCADYNLCEILYCADYNCYQFPEDIFKMMVLVHLYTWITRTPKEAKRTDRDVYKFYFMVMR